MTGKNYGFYSNDKGTILNIHQNDKEQAKKWGPGVNEAASLVVTKQDVFKLIWRRIPIFTILITIIQIAIFHHIVFHGRTLVKVLCFTRIQKEECWRLFTYMLVHTDVIHLALNIAMQIPLGSILEIEQGFLRISTVYFGGGIAGSLGTYAFDTKYKTVIGASAGCYALLLANMIHLLINYRLLPYWWQRMIMVSSATVIEVILNATSLDTKLISSVRLAQLLIINNKMCTVSHFFGGLYGLLISSLVFKRKKKTEISKAESFSVNYICIPFFYFTAGMGICYYYAV